MRTHYLLLVVVLLFVAGCGSKAKDEAWKSKLSAADLKAVEAQGVCPVTDKKLGTKGPPLKVTVKDQTVWICCMGCTDIIQSDADTYLAKLNKKK